MSRRNVIVLVGILLVLLVALLTFSLWLDVKRTWFGHMIRFTAGASGAVQAAEDLADDVRSKPELANLQEWSTQVLARYSSGRLFTNGVASPWAEGTIKLAPLEIPESIRNAWLVPPAEVTVRLSGTGQPECVVIAWAQSGIVVGPSGYKLSFNPPTSVQVKSGVYAYELYK